MNIIFALGIILHKALTFKKDKIYPVYNSTYILYLNLLFGI